MKDKVPKPDYVAHEVYANYFSHAHASTWRPGTLKFIVPGMWYLYPFRA